MTGKRRRVSNLLALAVLATLRERPMHPYEMAATMRAQGKERSIKLNYGSLYTVVDNLAKHGLIEAMEASREGRRPERTVYRLTDEGRTELEDWLTDLQGVGTTGPGPGNSRKAWPSGPRTRDPAASPGPSGHRPRQPRRPTTF